jgi:(S)-ureidoglycine aminohydrolase
VTRGGSAPVALALASLYLPALISIGNHSVHWVFGARGGGLHSFAGRPILVRLRSAQFEIFFDSNDMSQPFGSSRDVIKSRYALLTPDGFVPSAVPGWNNCIANIVISSALGSKLVQLLITMEKNGRGVASTGETECVVYVLEGRCRSNVGVKKRVLASGHYAYVPPDTDYEFKSERVGTRLLIFQKRFEPLPGQNVPDVLFGNSAKVEGVPFLGNKNARLQELLPDTLAFDMAVNIFVYQPGTALPFVETHIMEHGLLMLAGTGIYRLDVDWYPVQAGDVIWIAPYCPQWFAAIGDAPASYIYYKDVNRAPL